MNKLYRLLRLFFAPKCFHRWEEKQTSYTTNDELKKVGRYKYITKYCQCTKCGAWKSFKI